ncbi:TetR family transcriptional regulator [Longimycelium tulufanense]|uniref:TetR family transcriptional regulator n=1 Tax=Longimycelium tulufanense TaxID=907463 RepID=A0A8J3CLF1_9PSEU|nr:TetR/AcrR family transcriptional regulator [Longimycelium tulufanense]GGM84797.1 TetR family transcriptional regulator [Longimycelium tulufanense]
MARPRKISDERLLEATTVVVGRVGPGYTLAQVAEEAGVAPATLVQRFGSKHGLQQALSRSVSAVVIDRLRSAAASADDPLDALRVALLTWYDWADSPTEAGNHIAALGVDLVDPDLRDLLADHFVAVEGELAALVRRATAAGELPAAPGVPVATRILTALVHGTILNWSVRARGSLRNRLRRDLDVILDAWRRKSTMDTGEEDR